MITLIGGSPIYPPGQEREYAVWVPVVVVDWGVAPVVPVSSRYVEPEEARLWPIAPMTYVPDDCPDNAPP